MKDKYIFTQVHGNLAVEFLLAVRLAAHTAYVISFHTSEFGAFCLGGITAAEIQGQK